MRKALLTLALVAFVLFIPWKLAPFLHAARPDIAATPTALAGDPSQLSPITIPGGGGRACADRMVWGPDARYVSLVVQGTRPAERLDLIASAPGYVGRSTLTTPIGPGGTATVPIAAAHRDVSHGTLCVVNRGRHRVVLEGVDPASRAASPSTTTVDGRRVPGQLSVTLLRSPARSLRGQLGDIFHRVAAFRPVGAWVPALLLVLLLIGAPIALAVALAWAGGDDDRARRPEVPRADGHNGW